MSRAVSRRKVAQIVADGLLAGDKQIIKQLAAYLIETKQARQMNLMVREVESALSERGVLVADVASTHELGANLTREIESFLKQSTGAEKVSLRKTIDKSLIGGLRINTPGASLDTSIKNKLQQLRAAKQ